LSERDDVGVGNSDGERNSGAGEGLEDLGVAVEEFNLIDGGLRSEKLGYLRWGWEVVGHPAVVDSDGGGGGEEERESGREEEEDREIRHCWIGTGGNTMES